MFLSDVASSGATDLMIKSGTTSLMSLSLSTGIKYYTYTAFSNTAITNIGYTTFVAKILRCTGIIQDLEDHLCICKCRVSHILELKLHLRNEIILDRLTQHHQALKWWLQAIQQFIVRHLAVI